MHLNCARSDVLIDVEIILFTTTNGLSIYGTNNNLIAFRNINQNKLRMPNVYMCMQYVNTCIHFLQIKVKFTAIAQV